jgi:hypothetical protein
MDLGPTLKCIPSGRKISFLHPTIDQIHIEDVAHHLSLINRYCGGSDRGYNNAQHSWFIATMAPQPLKLPCLLHDGAEAYTGDLPGPLKHLPGMEFYCGVQDNITELLMRKHGIVWDAVLKGQVKAIEKYFFPWEEFITGRGVLPDWDENPDMDELWSPVVAERKFLALFKKLYKPPKTEFDN